MYVTASHMRSASSTSFGLASGEKNAHDRDGVGGCADSNKSDRGCKLPLVAENEARIAFSKDAPQFAGFTGME